MRGLAPAPPLPAAAPDESAAERRRRDLGLARRCIDGERAAQRALFDAHLAAVHRILRRMLGPGPDVEDAAQETMVRLFRSLPRFRGEATLATWVDRIAVRVAIDALAARRRRATVPLDDDLPAADAEVNARLDAGEVGRRLYAALDRLDPVQRVAFVLHAIEGHSTAEIAGMMGATRVATKSRVWRARRELERRARRDPLLAAMLSEKGEPP